MPRWIHRGADHEPPEQQAHEGDSLQRSSAVPPAPSLSDDEAEQLPHDREGAQLESSMVKSESSMSCGLQSESAAQICNLFQHASVLVGMHPDQVCHPAGLPALSGRLMSE